MSNKNLRLYAYGSFLLSIAWTLAAIIIVYNYPQNSFVVFAILFVLALMCAICAVILSVRNLDNTHTVSDSPYNNEQSIIRLIHASALIGYLIPLGHLYFPYLAWKKYRHLSPLINDSAIASLNFQLTCSIYLITSLMLVPLLVGVVLLPVVIIYHLVFVIYAISFYDAKKAYQYPGNLNFL